MDQVLRPGMRLLRRFRIAGKFALVATSMLVLLGICGSAGVAATTRQLSAADRERDGLGLARPVAQLVVTLCRARLTLVERGGPATVTAALSSELAAATAAVDAVERQGGRRFGVHEPWLRLRAELAGLSGPRPATAPNSTGPATRPVDRVPWTRATRHAIDLLAEVTDRSGLSIDPERDSHHLVVALAERVPAMLTQAAILAEDSPAGAAGAGPADGQLPRSSHDLLHQSSDALVAELTAAVDTSASRDRLAGLLRTSGGALTVALDGAVTSSAPGAGLTATVPQLGSNAVDAAAAGLQALLGERRQRLERDRWLALLPVGLGLLAAGYLLAALYRSTRDDARRVLADINSLTTGMPNETLPLTGVDEFGLMSQGVVSARDRLTSLLGTLRYQGTHDELTALPNRALFTDKLTEMLATERQVQVVVIDLDGFKYVNDSFGHVIGDRLLRTLGARFHRSVRRGDLVARLGADQFGVLMLDAGTERECAEAVEALTLSLEQPIDIDGRMLRARASVGIAHRAEGDTAAELLLKADVAMHAAKGGSGRVVRFEPAMHEATRERTELSYDLVQGFEHGELSIVYQPIVDLATETVHGVEALLRWNHPTRGPVSPTVFVPLAEATGLIVPIGRWVLHQAVRQLVTWHRAFPESAPLTMEVNLSADQLSDPALVGDVLSLINESGIDPGWLVLEITESTLVRDLDSALERLAQLSTMGVRLALDDFGTGYSSLSYLRRLPVSVLKIDKWFITDSDDGPDDELPGSGPAPGTVSGPAPGPGPGSPLPGSGAVLLRTIVELGTGLGMEIVAEGIENLDQLYRLRSAGCHLGQGFLWSRPVPPDAIDGMLARGGRFLPLPRQRTADTRPRKSVAAIEPAPAPPSRPL